MSETNEKWDDILAANPVLKEAGFADKVLRWELLRAAGEKAGLQGDELVKFIAHGMKKKGNRSATAGTKAPQLAAEAGSYPAIAAESGTLTESPRAQTGPR